MTTTRTVRVYADDFERAKVLALVWLGQSMADVFHTAIDEYYERHRPEMDARLARVSEAVLSNDRQKLRDLFVGDARTMVAAEAASIRRFVGDDEPISVEDDPDMGGRDEGDDSL